jgi:ribokinase
MGAAEDDDVLPDALRAATAAAALACTRPGAQEAMPTRTELLHFQQTRPPV